MKIVHISSSKRSLGNLGGVEKFAWYLQQATGCDLVVPGEVNLRAYDVVIGDGHYVSGADPTHQKVMSIVHGSWMEFAIRNNKLNDFVGEAQKQHVVWNHPSIKKIAVSQASANYLLKHHGVRADGVILNAVDVNLFKPVEHYNIKPVVIYAANDYNKDGQGRLGRIAELLKNDFEFRYLGAEAGEEQDKFAQGDIFIQSSFYEGNSYAAIEAMSCGLPVVASRAGLFEDTVFDFPIGEIVDWNAPAEDFVKAIKFLWSKKSTYAPREWVKKNANFNFFKVQWENYLRSI